MRSRVSWSANQGNPHRSPLPPWNLTSRHNNWLSWHDRDGTVLRHLPFRELRHPAIALIASVASGLATLSLSLFMGNALNIAVANLVLSVFFILFIPIDLPWPWRCLSKFLISASIDLSMETCSECVSCAPAQLWKGPGF